MTTDLETQIRDYFDFVDAEQAPVDLARLRSPEQDRPPVIEPGPRPRVGWVYAVGAAVLTFAVIGGISLLSSPDGAEPADMPTSTSAPTTETTVPSPSTSTPTPAPSSSFAPFIEGIGLNGPGAFSTQQREIEAYGETFLFVEAQWSVDWETIARPLVDDEARQSMSTAGLYSIWDPETNTVEFAGQVGSTEFETYALFHLEFTGTSGDWEVSVRHQATGETVGSITGSLPGLDPEEILARLGFGFSPARAGWFLETGDDEPVVLETPWARFHGLSPWSTPVELFVVDDLMLVFGMPENDGNAYNDGPWNVWRSSDGRVWEDLGELPFSSDLHPFVDFDLVSVGVAVLLQDSVGFAESHEFFITSDGAEWEAISEAEYEELTGLPVYGPDENPVPPDQAVETPDGQQAVDERFARIGEGATVLSDDPPMVQPLPGPEPRFDTFTLGEEIPFTSLTPDHPLAQDLAANFYDFIDPLPLPTGPIVFVGHASGTLGGYRLLWPTETNGYCGGTQTGGGCLGSQGIVPEDGVAVFDDDGLVTVPLDASVVVLRFNTETSLWQRPTGGWAIFPTAVDGDDTYWIDVYDADGNLMATTEE